MRPRLSETEWEKKMKFAQENIYVIPPAFRCGGARSLGGNGREREQVQVPDSAFMIMWGNAPYKRPLMDDGSDSSAVALIRHERPAPTSHPRSSLTLPFKLKSHLRSLAIYLLILPVTPPCHLPPSKSSSLPLPLNPRSGSVKVYPSVDPLCPSRSSTSCIWYRIHPSCLAGQEGPVHVIRSCIG